jgi:hypothetical protein
MLAGPGLNDGIAGSNRDRNMDVCRCLYSFFVKAEVLRKSSTSL